MGVDTGGAGDQGLMFGFACDETDELMPMPIMLAHNWPAGSPKSARKTSSSCLRPDGKSQVTVEYEGRPMRVDCVVVSTQHSEDVSNEELQPRNHRARDQAHHSSQMSIRTPSFTSIRPDDSWSAARWAMLD